MSLFRNALPQLAGDLFLTDGGIETTLMFLEGLELPRFAARLHFCGPHKLTFPLPIGSR